MVSMEELLNLMVQRGGSDLHLSVGSPPKIRVDGRLEDTEYDVLQPEVAKKLVYSVLAPDLFRPLLARQSQTRGGCRYPAQWQA